MQIFTLYKKQFYGLDANCTLQGTSDMLLLTLLRHICHPPHCKG
ncbi:hypothetical protein ApDm4_1379 [Acetobacter pomorum]|nr:hypothetical protein ApDm4_1379 [Acetobacter pomorum]